MKPVVAEFVGTMLLVLLGDGVVAGVLLNKSKAQNSGWIVITTGWGLAVALAAGIATRLAALLAAVVMLEIIVSLAVTAGLSALTMPDGGVFCPAVRLTDNRHHRFPLRRRASS